MLGVLWVAATAVLAYFLRPANRASLDARAAWLQRTCRRCLRVLHLKIETVGHLPHGALLTPNHVGYMDILILSALAPTVFVSKAEVGSWPLFGWFAKRAGTRFLRRDLKRDLPRVGAELGPVIDHGINLVIFLEGTSTDGLGVIPFKPSLLEPAVQGAWPVAPVALIFFAPPGHDASIEIAWWGTMPLPQHLLTFAGLEWSKVRVTFGPVRVATGERKAMASQLQKEVQELMRIKSP